MKYKLFLAIAIASLSPCAGEEIIPDNHGGYLSIDQDRSVFISNPRNTYIGEIDDDGDFIALGRRGGTSAFGTRVGRNAVIVLESPVE
jgi:hypothetical protein